MFKSAAFLPALVLAVFAACAAMPVSAKPLSQILAQSPLAPADFNAMRAAEAALYEHAGVKVGSSVKWNNPETSSHGVVKVTSKRGGCISLQHRAYPNGGSSQSELSRKFCKSASGTWLLSQ
ncbi:hypothetical protein [Pseudophaeobacter sp. EL27]|uniref:hypothetical protein n=1 Tax=Pseudophaeobacter sp. EL27 TaxID=2107580 RepID=UPI000EFD728C|nr:hypothetical protein [Pseudophaeobacter sp. EL27]